MATNIVDVTEQKRLNEAREAQIPWKKWGPYLSERQWGTVREDYSENGDAWNYFSHDQARSRAYRWGEDGLAGISDDHQRLCFALALWNGKDVILKERLFGLTNSEANHGEDVKEYYFYLDSTPTHSYMKYLYKYPQAAYPYVDLIETNRRRNRQECEYELLDTGVFDQERYFDVFVEYAKASPEDLLIQITVENRGPEPATLHVLPTLWFRNVWSWGGDVPRPVLRQAAGEAGGGIVASHSKLGERRLYAEGAAALLFTENETNQERLFNSPNRTPYVKDGIDSYIVQNLKDAVNPEKTGTKAAAHYPLTVAAGTSRTVRLRLSDVAPAASAPKKPDPFGDFDAVMRARRQEADEFYATVIPSSLKGDAANVMRQALAGMLWSKQYYYYDVDRWLTERGADPFKAKDRSGNNVFEGGFLGLDNIGVFDRSAPLPTGGHLEQADGTAWMALFCQNMLEISVELAMHRPAYVDMAVKFVEHFLWIASSMVHAGEDVGMWDEEDGFFYDVLRLPDGGAQRLKVRSMVGLLPLCAATVFQGQLLAKYPELRQRFKQFLGSRPELTAFIHDPSKPGHGGRHLAAVLSETKLRRVLATMLDEKEFLSPYGLRSISRYHAEHPYVFRVGDQEHRVSYLPAESDTGMFGGNSNWRGPIWMPVNGLIIRALLQYHTYYGKNFTIECPTGSGRYMNLYQVAEELTRRLASIFLRDSKGRRPIYGGTRKFQEDPHWSDYLQFFEYFHGDNGAGLGASHQTGWTGTIARAMHVFATSTAEQFLELGKAAAITEVEPARRGQSGEAAPSRKR